MDTGVLANAVERLRNEDAETLVMLAGGQVLRGHVHPYNQGEPWFLFSTLGWYLASGQFIAERALMTIDPDSIQAVGRVTDGAALS